MPVLRELIALFLLVVGMVVALVGGWMSGVEAGLIVTGAVVTLVGVLLGLGDEPRREDVE